MSDKLQISAGPLRELLVALTGPAHHIREVQVTADPALFPDNPLVVVLREFNEQAEKEKGHNWVLDVPRRKNHNGK